MSAFPPAAQPQPYRRRYRTDRPRLPLRWLLLCLFLPLHAALSETPAEPTVEQILFWEAKKAIQNDQPQRYRRYAGQLKDYPLHPYLLYWELQYNLAHTEPERVQSFLKRYAELPPAKLLRRDWLYELARQGRWKLYLQFYTEMGINALRCHYHFAQYKTGKPESAWQGAKALWLVGHSQESACDPLFAAWEAHQGITPSLRWDRIELALRNSNDQLADYLARKLPESEQPRYELWRRALRDPGALGSPALAADSKINRRIILSTLHRHAYLNAEATAERWAELGTHYRFTPAQRLRMTHALAGGFAAAHDPRALEWFEQLPRQERTPSVARRALRVALRTDRWGEALSWLSVLPADERHSPRSLYWRGRSYEMLGFVETAQHYYDQVSRERGYYGFLAADRLNRPYNLESTPLSISEAITRHVAKQPGIVRAHELYQLGLIVQARREWALAVAGMDREAILAAGKLADEWGWHDRALLTLARADHFDDLHIRFPLRFSHTVKKEAERQALDPAWVFAVARQESSLMPNVQSPVGALGLMQLMPSTGRAMAQQLKLSRPDRRQLLDPAINIRLGSYYLDKVLNEFDENPVLATAAYNAGPHRIRQWYPDSGSMAADIWVETIPFVETRNYVRMVMAYAVFYDQRLERPITRLEKRMPPVGAKKTTLSRHEKEADDKAGS